MIKKLLITGCTIMLLTACGTDSTNEEAGTINEQKVHTPNNKVENSSNMDIPSNSTTLDIINPPVSMKEAVTIFMEAHPDAKIESIDLDTDSGRMYYDIDGFDSLYEYEVEIDAMTKEVKENEVERETDDDHHLDFSAIIDPEKAIEIASTQTEAEGLSPTKWSLEADDRKQTYTIEYDTNDSDIDIKIDAVTEEVLEVEVDK